MTSLLACRTRCTGYPSLPAITHILSHARLSEGLQSVKQDRVGYTSRKNGNYLRTWYCTETTTLTNTCTAQGKNIRVCQVLLLRRGKIEIGSPIQTFCSIPCMWTHVPTLSLVLVSQRTSSCCTRRDKLPATDSPVAASKVLRA